MNEFEDKFEIGGTNEERPVQTGQAFLFIVGKPRMIGTTMPGQSPPATAPYVNRLDSWPGRF